MGATLSALYVVCCGPREQKTVKHIMSDVAELSREEIEDLEGYLINDPYLFCNGNRKAKFCVARYYIDGDRPPYQQAPFGH